ncbi:MAG TPA: hypothetical protein VMY37_18720 [Thermoguttaceae bacterium]|nr:hypothetical protein [Thermoguttaceae bacterium]
MNDAVAGVVWLVANLLLLSSAWLWSRRLFPRDGLRQTTIHVLALCWACVVANTLALGAFGILSPALLLATVCASCVVALAVLWATGGQSRSSDLLRRSARRERWWGAAWGLLGAFFVAHVIFHGVLAFPTDWDSLAYHIPLVDHWLREGTLYVPDCAFWYCPGNNEVLGLWLVAPFSGDYLIALGNLPAAILLAAAAVELATACGVSRPLCHLTGMAIVTTRPMLRQLVSAENDVAVAALFLATLVYGVRYARYRKPADVILASVTLGLLTGVKYYALGYVAVAGIGLVALLAACGRRRDALRAAAMGIAGALILGGYWYLRNACATGAPLYPMGFTESTDLWAVIRPGSHTSTLLRSGRPEVWPLVISAVATMAGPCQLAATILLPVTLTWLAVSALMIRDRAPSASRLRVWLLLVIALSGLVFVVTPNVVETVPGMMNMLKLQYHPVRFGLCFLSTSTVGVAIVLDDMVKALTAGSRSRTGKSPTPKPRTIWSRLPGAQQTTSRLLHNGIYGLWSVGVGYQLAYHVYHSREHFTLDLFLLALVVFVSSAALFFCLKSPSACQRPLGYVVVLCAFPAAVWCCHGLAGRWHDGFARHFDSHFNVDLFTSLARLDPGSERLCVCDYRYYPFFGSRRQFEVCRPLWLPDDSYFLQYTRRQEVTLLVTRNEDSNPLRRYARVKQWITARPELFRPFHEDDKYAIVRVDRAELTAATVPSKPGL